MLVLTRKCGQKLIIADNIEITILETRGDAVKIGINAPKNIAVYRKEIHDEIKKSNMESAKGANLTDLDEAMKLVAFKLPLEKPYYGKFQDIINTTRTDDSK